MTHKGVIRKVDPVNNEITIYFEDFSVIKHFLNFVEMAVGISLHRWKEDRSIAQNNFLWACIKDISRVTRNPNRWEIYLEILRKHGDFTHVLIRPEAVEKFSREWRVVENLGEKLTEKGKRQYSSDVFTAATYIQLMKWQGY